MPFNFSFSSSVTFVSTASGNGEPRGWAYRREAFSNNAGSGVRTTQQNLGEAPVMQTRMYDAQGRPLLISGSENDGQRHNTYRGTSRRIISIEDVTEEEAAAGKTPARSQQQNSASGQ